MAMTRELICRQTAGKLGQSLPKIAAMRSLIGLDGFVDEIIAVVSKWTNKTHYEPVPSIEVMGKKILNAAGASSNYELVVKQMKLGGNGPIMANALASIGMKVTYLGIVGYPEIHPVFRELADRAEIITVGEPGHTDALEFSDGKLMLGKLMVLRDLTWENLVKRAGGVAKLTEMFARSSLIGMANWTMLPHMSEIWASLQKLVVPKLPKSSRSLFVDLADPEKRTAADIKAALKLVSGFSKTMDVTLGLNLKESGEIAEVLGLGQERDPEASIERTAARIREKMGIACVVIHPRSCAAAATREGAARFAGPFVRSPKISTGAGDHFNAGFCLGRSLGFTLEESLCTGVATSGFYVRFAKSPSARELAKFIAKLPAPEK